MVHLSRRCPPCTARRHRLDRRGHLRARDRFDRRGQIHVPARCERARAPLHGRSVLGPRGRRRTRHARARTSCAGRCRRARAAGRGRLVRARPSRGRTRLRHGEPRRRPRSYAPARRGDARPARHRAAPPSERALPLGWGAATGRDRGRPRRRATHPRPRRAHFPARSPGCRARGRRASAPRARPGHDGAARGAPPGTRRRLRRPGRRLRARHGVDGRARRGDPPTRDGAPSRPARPTRGMGPCAAHGARGTPARRPAGAVRAARHDPTLGARRDARARGRSRGAPRGVPCAQGDRTRCATRRSRGGHGPQRRRQDDPPPFDRRGPRARPGHDQRRRALTNPRGRRRPLPAGTGGRAVRRDGGRGGARHPQNEGVVSRRRSPRSKRWASPTSYPDTLATSPPVSGCWSRPRRSRRPRRRCCSSTNRRADWTHPRRIGWHDSCDRTPQEAAPRWWRPTTWSSQPRSPLAS